LKVAEIFPMTSRTSIAKEGRRRLGVAVIVLLAAIDRMAETVVDVVVDVPVVAVDGIVADAAVGAVDVRAAVVVEGIVADAAARAEEGTKFFVADSNGQKVMARAVAFF
jgi:hypothetical protein